MLTIKELQTIIDTSQYIVFLVVLEFPTGIWVLKILEVKTAYK